MKKEVNGSPFSRESETHEKILSHLKSNSRGLSTQEIEQQTTISRKAVEKHLQILLFENCLLYTSPSPRDATLSRMPSSA